MSSGRAYQAGSIRLWEVPCTMGTDHTVLAGQYSMAVPPTFSAGEHKDATH